jgi:ribosome biogenesis GTPase / thiamine phosphate phosphatase
LARTRYGRAIDMDEFEQRAGERERRSRKPKPREDAAGLVQGIVVRARGHHYDVLVRSEARAKADADADAAAENNEATTEAITEGYGTEVRMCEVRGRLLQEKSMDTLVAVGDTVWISRYGKAKGHIERVEERHSVLSRQRPFVNVPAEDVILANPDQVVVVFAAAQPEPHLRMVDRFLVVAAANELPAVVCVNKVDLIGEAAARELFGVYEKIGYPVLYVSAETGVGIDELRDVLLDRISVFSGPSGVGKSSLLNTVQPGLNLQIGGLREMTQRGKHTTRAAQLFSLPVGQGTFVADTPGIRELGLYDIEPDELGFFFLEFVDYFPKCRYPNCTHDHEPGCAVRAAVEAGEIAQVRYDSYLRLLHGEE